MVHLLYKGIDLFLAINLLYSLQSIIEKLDLKV